MKQSRPRSSVALPRGGDFNTVVSLDLESMGEKYILWMVCTCTRFMKGAVISNKELETIIRALHEEWCLDVGFPKVGF